VQIHLAHVLHAPLEAIVQLLLQPLPQLVQNAALEDTVVRLVQYLLQPVLHAPLGHIIQELVL
jgi:hypothetical protein